MDKKTCRRILSGSHHPSSSSGRPGIGVWIWSALVLVLCLAAAGPAMADCTDGDGDGYGNPGDSDCPNGSATDCNDGNAAINPGAAEICNGVDDDCDTFIDLVDPEFNDPDPIDGVDNDGDTEVDEGFGRCLFAEDGPGCTGTLLGEPDCCKTGGATQCVAGAFQCVNPNANDITYTAENDPGGAVCTDGINNDCDCNGDTLPCDDPTDIELTDLDDPGCQEPEICDGLDNDGNDGPDEDFPLIDPGNVGGFCTDGIGECESSGTYSCDPDGLDASCSAVPHSPGNEGTLFGLSCQDGKDNDCDGLTDLADPDCAGFGDPELCGNGIDDDGDGLIDEGFPTIGLPCTAGIGACTTIGELVCNGAGDGTECDAVPGAAGFEDSESGTCTDSVDNDCDGLTDAADEGCGATFADLGVTCSLPYTHGKPGSDCTSKHFLEFGAENPQAVVTADLLALDSEGTLLAVIEDVQPGDAAHLASRLDPEDWHHSTKSNVRGTRHTMFYPIPLLKVTATLGSVEDVAYCSILPYLEVTQPDGQTISLSEGNSLDVSGYLPLADVDTLAIYLDGEDIVTMSGLDPVTDFPTTGGALCTTPGECVVQIEAGCGDGSLVDVEISNLRVEGLDTGDAFTAREGVAVMDQINTVNFTVTNLPAGGHIFYFIADPLPLPRQLSAECNVDDLADAGTASAFGITIDEPQDQDVVASAPVNVEGTVCGGNEIASTQINGHPLDVSIPTSQVCTTGDGMFSTDECVVDFNEPIGETDLAKAAQGVAPIGTFKRGSNRIIADAIDVEGNRTFNTDVIFGLGPVQTATAATSMKAALGVESALRPAYDETLASLTATLDPAFVVGLEEAGAQDFFNQKCTEAIDQFTSRATANLNNKSFGTIDIKPDCSCDLNNVPLVLEQLKFTHWDEVAGGEPTCAVDMEPGQVNVKVHLPSIRIQIGVHKSCTDRGLFGECIARTRIDVTAVTRLENLSFDFSITEEQIETKTPPEADSITFTWSVLDNDGNELFPNPGTCAGGVPAGDCFADAMCDPVPIGKCSGGPDADAACTSNSECGIGNFGSCTGGDNDGKVCTNDGECPGGGTCHGKCVGECNITKNDAFNPLTRQNSTIECWGAAICTAFEVIGAVFISAFTFGLVNGFEVIDFIEFDADFAEDFLDGLAAAEPDPMELDNVEIDEDKVSAFGDTTFTPLPIDVEIEDGGLTIAFGAQFTSEEDAAEIDDTPPPPSTPAAAPSVPQIIASSDDISVLIADDVFATSFAAMREAGRLQAFCTDADGLTVDDLLPAEIDGGCEILLADSALPDIVKAPAQGLCHALRDTDCESLLGPNINLTAIEQGACHGFEDHDCTMLATGFDGIQLPADCDSIGLSAEDSEDPEFVAGRSSLIAQGRCHGLAGADCETLVSGGTDQETAFKQGACHGEQGADCTAIPTTVGAANHEIGTCGAVKNGNCQGIGIGPVAQCLISRTQISIMENILRIAEEASCNATPSRNVSATDGLLLCARVDMEPDLLFADDDATDNTVDTHLVLNDVNVVFGLDRAADGYTGELEALQGCFGQEGNVAPDCLLFAACLDMTMDAVMGIDNTQCSPGQTGFVFGIPSLIIPPEGIDLGVLCSAAAAADDQLIAGQGFNSDVINVIENASAAFSPPFCADGLTLGGVLDFTSDDAKLFAITTDEATPGFADYLGITGGLGPPSP